jgi:hypothetical protein
MIYVDWRDRVRSSARDPELVVTVWESGEDLAVSVEFHRDEDGPYVTGVAVRRDELADGWKGERTHVPARDIQRRGLASAVEAARAVASVEAANKPWIPDTHLFPPRQQVPLPGSADSHWYSFWGDDPSVIYGPEGLASAVTSAARKVLLPRGKPQPGKSTEFYREIAKAYRELAAEGTGKSPVKEIARRKGVPENTVHQWIHKARKLKFLEPSTRKRGDKVKNAS